MDCKIAGALFFVPTKFGSLILRFPSFPKAQAVMYNLGSRLKADRYEHNELAIVGRKNYPCHTTASVSSWRILAAVWSLPQLARRYRFNKQFTHYRMRHSTIHRLSH